MNHPYTPGIPYISKTKGMNRRRRMVTTRMNQVHWTLMMLTKQMTNKKAFFLRHTTCLPSSSSQVVWSGPCLRGGGPLPPPLLGGVLFHCHFQGGPLPPPLLGGPLPPPLLGGPFHHHFWGSHVLLYTAIECPPASWEQFTWDPSWIELDRLTDKHV